MKIFKILSLIFAVALTSQIAYAQSTCGASWTGAFAPAQAAALCSAKNFSFGQSTGLLSSNTVNGADSKGLCMNGGGATSTLGSSASRGSSLCVYGNEHANVGGFSISTGDAATGDGFVDLVGSSSDFIVRNASAVQKFIVNQGGDAVFPASGNTISVQEATASTACMGISTPNGTTPVAVTTSCATTGSRVFFTRVGSVTNMASISTTTAPSGTGFSFASTGASDTTASSVVWLIVKESA